MIEKKIFLVRHAESEGNAGGLIPHDNIIKITQKGKEQAEILTEKIDNPNRIIVSKLIRTIETAEPTIKKFPNSEVHLWIDTHEFDPIGAQEVYKMKEFAELDIFIEKYFASLDPHAKVDDEVETFAEFVNRVDLVYSKLKKIDNGVNYLFTHGWFIKLFLLMGNEFPNFTDRKNENNIYKNIMKRFAEFDKEFVTKNTGVYEVTDLIENYGK